MKKDKTSLSTLVSKLKVETLSVEHRAPIAKLLRGSGDFAVYKLPFDDYGDLLIDQDGLDSLLAEQERIEQIFGDIIKTPNGRDMTDEEYGAYTEYLAINAIRDFIGV